MLDKPVVLPTLALLAAWRWEGHGPPHPALTVDEAWVDEDSRRELDDRIMAALTRVGLALRGGLTGQFRDVLAVLAHADHECYGWIGRLDAGDTGAVLAAGAGRDAIRLIRDDRRVRLDRLPAPTLERSLVDALPRVPPARIEPITVPKSAYSPGGSSPPGPGDRLAELMRARRTGQHPLHAAKRTRGGGRVRGPQLTVVDVAGQGRVLTSLVESPGAEPRITCVPGTPEALVGALNSQQAALT
ncbi:ESX secretion-associated protein EspG [Amycolatopsis anabasis]|uniref:ESX secretion-associated protein EspG n=1 Tax=Amycolatopsis anabasis TaxID=1840409 RepID=UPI00131E00AE|nr:ESX secretion-associated protein EspG [Amycolatopsis anabasis]